MRYASIFVCKLFVPYISVFLYKYFWRFYGVFQNIYQGFVQIIYDISFRPRLSADGYCYSRHSCKRLNQTRKTFRHV